MKYATLGLLLLTTIQGLFANVANSPEIDQRVFALTNTPYAVDVDMDGTDDVFFYADLAALLANSGEPDASHLSLTTAANVSVSAMSVPVGPSGPYTAFTTLSDERLVGDNLSTYLLEWADGDIPFLGFEIGGGIPSQDCYLAVRLEKGFSVHYGWIRLIFPVNYDHYDETGYFKIKETSYVTLPSLPIFTGSGKTELDSTYSSTIATGPSSSLDIEVNDVTNRLCELLESTNLVDWDSVSVEYATQANHTTNVSTGATAKFYRWNVTENLEEAN